MIRTQDDKKYVLAQIQSELCEIGCDLSDEIFKNGHVPRVLTMADELISNSVFAANPKYRAADPTMGFSLETCEAVHFEWGFDGTTLGLSAIDSFGSLRSRAFFEALFGTPSANKMRSGQRSGGNGFKTILSYSNSMIVNVAQCARTSVHLFLDFTPSLKATSQKPKQIEFFNH